MNHMTIIATIHLSNLSITISNFKSSFQVCITVAREIIPGEKQIQKEPKGS